MKFRLLVIGGNGFIGRNVAAHALSLGWEVISLGLSGQGQAGIQNLAADLSDLDMITKVIGKTRFHFVVNCGGYIDHTQFGSGGRNLIDTHFNGVLNLVQLLDRTSLKRFINIGSSDEYGGISAPQSESIREAPITPYSFAKVAATHFLQMMHITENFPSVSLRLFLTYGPGQDSGRFLPQIIRGCLENRDFSVSKGEQLRDFCYVDDVVQAVFAALRTDSAVGEVFNIGSGVGISIRTMIEKVCRIVGGGAPQFGDLPYRRGENMSLYADIGKAAKLLGWSPLVDLETGLKRTIDSYRKLN